MAITIPFIADVARWLRGTRDVEDSLDDVGDAIDDLARDSARSSDTAADKLEKSYRDALREVSDQARRTGDDVGDHMTRGTKRAEDGVDEFRDEANSTAREAAASFDGSAESIADAFQEVAANAFAGFGPAGAAAGLAAAAGLGFATQALQAAADKANEAAQRAGEWAIAWRDATTDERVGMLADRWDEVATAISDAKSAWEVWQPRAITNAEQFAQSIAQGAVNAQDLMDAFTDADPAVRLDKMRTVSNQLRDALAKVNDEGRRYAIPAGSMLEADRKASNALAAKRDALEGARKALTDQIAVEEQAAEVTKALAKANGYDSVDAYNRAEKAAQDAAAAQEQYAATVAAMGDPADVFNAALATNQAKTQAWAEDQAKHSKSATDSWEDFADKAPTAVLSIDEVLDELAARVQQRRDFETNLRTLASRGYGALSDELRAGGPEANGALVDLLAKAGDDKVRTFAENQGYLLGRALGKRTADGTSSQASALQGAIDGLAGSVSAPSLRLPVTVDDSAVRTWVRNIGNTTARLNVSAQVTGMRVM